MSKKIHQCKKCSKYLTGYQKKFCSKSCAAMYNNTRRKPRTEESKKKTSEALKGRPNIALKGKKKARSIWPRTPIFRKECSCGNSFWAKGKWGKKTCSPECARKNQTYRKIIYEYKHNGEIVLLESSWEVEIAIWLDENNIKWTRPAHIPWIDSSGKHRKYFPDFYLPEYNVYLDPKNSYQIQISQEKLEIISQHVTLKYGTVEDIKDWVDKIIQE